jgi:hypothetical protein
MEMGVHWIDGRVDGLYEDLVLCWFWCCEVIDDRCGSALLFDNDSLHGGSLSFAIRSRLGDVIDGREEE